MDYIKCITDSTRNLSINAIYDAIRSFNGHKKTSIEDSKLIFIETLRFLVESKQIILYFRDYLDNKSELDKLTLDKQLNYIYNSFPLEYDESIPEKDIDNLWWYIGCPVDIGWLQDDGTYWFS